MDKLEKLAKLFEEKTSYDKGHIEKIKSLIVQLAQKRANIKEEVYAKRIEEVIASLLVAEKILGTIPPELL